MGHIIQLQVRRDLAATWTSTDTVLLASEIGFEADTGWHKIGDGSTAWTSLPYYHGPPWLQGVDAGNPSSTYPGAPTGAFIGVMSSAPIPPPDPLVYDSTGLTDLDEIYGFGYDGANTVLIAAADDTAGWDGFFITDPEFSYLTKLVEDTDLPSWEVAFNNNKPMNATWCDSLGLWVLGSSTGQTWWSTDLVTFNYIPMGTGWGSTVSDPVQIWWDEGLEVLYMSSADTRPLLISTTGKGWTDQETVEMLGGTHPTKLQGANRFDIGATTWHLLFQHEEYLYKTGDSGGSTGWTKTANNGVLGGTGGLSPIGVYATDGTAIAVVSASSIAVGSDPSDHPDTWGPNGTNNFGFFGTGIGLPDFNGTHTVMAYLPQFSRPWILFNTSHGWYDTDVMPTDGVTAPTFTRVTAEPWAAAQAEFEADSTYVPKINLNRSSIATFHTGYDAEGVWGTKGFGFIMDKYQFGSLKDYIVMQRPF